MGRSWTPKSKHLRNPAEAADLVTVRRGKKDFKDIDQTAGYQGSAVAIGHFLKDAPCDVFGSTVRDVLIWKTVRDLYHIEILPKKDCKRIV